MRTAAAESPVARTVAFGPFSFDRTSRLLWRDGVEVALPPRVLGVLALLLDRSGDVVTKQELMAAVWPDAFVTETSLAEAVSVLRQTLGDDPQRPSFVQTLHRRGYRFIAELRDATPHVAVAARTRQEPVRTAAPPERSPSLLTIVPWALALVASLAAISATWQYLKLVEPPPRQPARFTVTLPDGLKVGDGGGSVAVSNDGALIALSACRGSDCGIYLRPLSQLDPILIAATSGGSAPFFAPDGRSLGYFAGGRLYTLALAGGSPVDVTAAREPLGAAWLPDGHIVFARSPDEGLFIVNAAGGPVQPLTTPGQGERGHHWPAAVPDGSAVVFTVDASRHYAGVVSMRTRRWSRLLDDVIGARVPVPGYLIAQRGGSLIAGAVDTQALSMTGLPVPVADLEDVSGAPHFTASAAGTLVLATPGAGVLHVVLDWASDLRRLVPAARPPVSR